MGAFAEDRLNREQRLALDNVADAKTDLVTARDGYRSMVLRAHDLGISSSAIARSAGVTEPAIRMFIKRNGVQRD